MFQIQIRVVVGIMIFCGYFLIYVIRYNISVHIIDMIQVSKRVQEINIERENRNAGIVEMMSWDETKMAIIFSSYHMGYCICFPIFHSLGDKLGPKWVVAITGLISGLLCCLTPVSAYCNFYAFVFVRIVQGFCSGAMQPSMVQILGRWVPPTERNKFMWAQCGITTGTCFTFLLCSAIQYYSRWPIGFYIVGAMQVMWSIAWILFVTNNPKHHWCISKEELTYLKNTIGNIFTIKLMNSHAPWSSILKSVPFWALCILNFGYSWNIIGLCIHGPLYYSKVVNYNIYQAAALTALPFFLRFVLGIIAIHCFYRYKLIDYHKRKQLKRKYFIVVSHIIPGLLLSACWLFPVYPGPILLTTAVALTGAGMDMTLELCYDLTPNYWNSVMTVIKIIGNTSGIIVPLCVGHAMHYYNFSARLWKNIWCSHAVVLLISGLFYLIWGETEAQSWNFSTPRQRQRHMNIVRTNPSMMSNITEVEEDELSNAQTC